MAALYCALFALHGVLRCQRDDDGSGMDAFCVRDGVLQPGCWGPHSAAWNHGRTYATQPSLSMPRTAVYGTGPSGKPACTSEVRTRGGGFASACPYQVHMFPSTLGGSGPSRA